MQSELGIRKRLALEVYRKLRQNKIKEHTLQQLFWECTLRCNIHCRHCSSDCKKSASPDMPLNDFLQVIDTIIPHVNPNTVNIVITGGEPLMREDLEECGLALYHRGFPWGFVTNGLYLNRQRLDSLLAAGLRCITVSLDGFKEEHNWMRGHKESFTKATEAISMIAQEKGLAWDVVTCVNKKNIGYLNLFKEFLISLGVKKWRIFTIFPVGRAAENPELQLSDKEFTNLMEFIKQTRKEGKINLCYGCEGFLGRYEGEVRDNFYNCQAGINVASILSNGSISACPSIRSNYTQGNIYKDKIMDVWENKFQNYRDRSWMKIDQCGDCKLFRYCEGNGMHLRDDNGKLLFCHHKRILPKATINR